MSKFLSYAPPITHSGAIATNVFSKLKLVATQGQNPYTYHPYVIKDGDRPDTIANAYYGSPEYAWLIYLANDIVDPYYDWPLSYSEFAGYLVDKYGSVEYAQEKILFYTVNWENDETSLTVPGYNALPASLKKYWSEVYDYFGGVSSYVRNPLGLSVETNKIISVGYTITTGTSFSGSDKILQVAAGTTTASGFLKTQDSSSLTLDKIDGEFVVGQTIQNYSGDTTATITSVSTLLTVITEQEAVYWSPVTAYDYEEIQNEAKKTINIIDAKYVDTIEQRLKQLSV
jgi:hypothetical protein